MRRLKVFYHYYYCRKIKKKKKTLLKGLFYILQKRTGNIPGVYNINDRKKEYACKSPFIFKGFVSNTFFVP